MGRPVAAAFMCGRARSLPELNAGVKEKHRSLRACTALLYDSRQHAHFQRVKPVMDGVVLIYLL